MTCFLPLWVMLIIGLFLSSCIETRSHSVRVPSQNMITPHVLELTAFPGTAPSQSRLQRLLRKRQTQHPTAKLDLTTVHGRVYLASLQFGIKTYTVVIDTGSSDTWLVQDNFQCLAVDTYVPAHESACQFGEPYDPSSNFTLIPNEAFNITYADGEKLTGSFGTETLTVGGLSITQAIGVVNTASWLGDGQSSGLMGLGLAHPSFKYTGSGSPQATNMYTSFFTTLYTTIGIPPIFSLALSRPASVSLDTSAGGLLALGGIPSDVTLSTPFVTAPIQLLSADSSSRTPTSPNYQYYATTIDGFDIAPSTSPPNLSPPVPALNASLQMIVDSGTTLTYIPDVIAEYYNSLFDPSGEWDDERELWIVDCASTVPAFAILIGGQSFAMNETDLVLPAGGGACMSAVQPIGVGLAVLGDAFFKSVLVVFDVGAEEMRFAGRANY